MRYSKSVDGVLEKLLSIRLPIIQAPMAGVQDAELAAAVSNAGGLGSLPCAMLSPTALEAQLLRLSTLTDNPVNLNFFCHTTPTIQPQQLLDWNQRLAGYFEELKLEQAHSHTGASREPFSDAALALLEKYKPAVISFHFGLPNKRQIAHIKRWGTHILASATTVEEARWLTQRGVDAVIAQGLEAGGHRGSFLTTDMTTQMGTMALVPRICSAVSVPVIAAGGIAGPEGVAAAMALGAAGVQVGTAFLLCVEAKTTALHRAALRSDASQHTALTNVFTGRPARGIVNRLVREVGPMSASAPPFPSAAGPVAALRSAAEANGSHDFTPLWSGQNTTGCCEIPAAKLLQKLASGCPNTGARGAASTPPDQQQQ